MNLRYSNRKSTVAAALALASISPAAATAATTISSSATGVSGSLRVTSLVLPTVEASIAPISQSSGTAAPAYSRSDSLASANQSLSLGPTGTSLLSQGVSTGVVQTRASSAFPVTATGAASAVVNDLGLALLGARTLLSDINFLSLAASAITSTTSYDGQVLTGASTIAGLRLSSEILPLSLVGSLTATPQANTTLVDILGLRVVLNEQIGTSTIVNGIATQSLTTNAVRLVYNNYAIGTRILNGDIIVGQSRVSVSSAVPEASTWAMMVLGFGALGAILRAGKRRSPAMSRAA